MTDQKPDKSLEDLGDDLAARIRHAKGVEAARRPKDPKLKNETSGLGQAFCIGTEMISALAVGVGLGWWLDKTFETKPWFMLICIFLGAGAGILNVYRTAMRMADDFNEEPEATPKEDL